MTSAGSFSYGVKYSKMYSGCLRGLPGVTRNDQIWPETDASRGLRNGRKYTGTRNQRTIT